MRKYLIGVAAVMALLAVVAVGPARADNSDEWAPNSYFKDAPRSITGVVERTKAGLAIRSGGTDYMVAGKDLSALAGQKVAATGKITVFGGNRTIAVTSAEPYACC